MKDPEKQIFEDADLEARRTYQKELHQGFQMLNAVLQRDLESSKNRRWETQTNCVEKIKGKQKAAENFKKNNDSMLINIFQYHLRSRYLNSTHILYSSKLLPD